MLSKYYITYLYTRSQVRRFVIQDELPYKRQWRNLVARNQIWQIMVWDWSTIIHMVVKNELRKCYKYDVYCFVSFFLQDHHTKQ